LRLVLFALVLLFLVGTTATLLQAEPVSNLIASPNVAKVLGILHARAIGQHMTQEFGTAIQDDGSYRIVMGEDGQMSAHVKPDAHTVLMAHTHPDGGDPKPSPADIAVAKSTGIPDVVISRYATYVALPDGTVQKLN
jgi:hypothetical protein